MPLTTCPLRTSRQAMIRLESIEKILQHQETDIPRFLGMKLHAEYASALDGARKRHAMRSDRDCVARDGSGVRVGEVHLRSGRDTLEEARRPRKLQRVPS